MPRIRKTKDYDLFNLEDWNRNIKPSHLAEIVSSIKAIGNLTDVAPVIVLPLNPQWKDEKHPDGRHPVYDGQYRFTACKELGEYIYYVVDEDERLKPWNVAQFQSQDRWNYDDYAKHFANLGHKNYKIYCGIKRRSGWSHNSLIMLFMGNTKGSMVAFKTGGLEFLRTVNEVNAIIEQINEFSHWFKWYKQRGFINALLKIIESVDDYSHDTMMQKVEFQSTKLVRCPDTETYMALLEDIYNYQSRGKKVRFL